MTRRIRAALALALVVSSSASVVLGEHTQKWLTRTEADFNKGELRNLVLTSTGELRLSRELKNLLADDAQIETVSALAEGADGTLFAAVSGTQSCRVIAVSKGKMRTVRSFSQDAQIYALLADGKGKLFIGVSGEEAKVVRVSTDAEERAGAGDTSATKPAGEAAEDVVFAEEGVQYIWAIAFSPEGDLYVATGPDGKLFLSKTGGTNTPPQKAEAEVLFDAEAANLTSIAVTRSGTLYLGSDPEGLVYKFDVKTKQASVVFDAPESEITALTLDAAGNLYVAAGAVSSQGAPSGDGTSHPSRGMPDPLAPEKRDPDLPEPPMTPPEPAPKKEPGVGEPGAKEPGASLFSRPDRVTIASPRKVQGIAHFAKAAPPNPAMPLSIPEHLLKMSLGSRDEPKGETSTDGSAVYRIDSEGLVTEIFRAPLTIYTLAEHNGSLLIATGAGSEEKPEGVLYELNLRREEVAQIARATGKDVTALLPMKDGTVAVGVSNGGAIATLSAGLASGGSYQSELFDAGSVARLGTLRLEGSLPEGASLTIATRSGNTEEPSETGWSKWSGESPATHFVKISSPAGRYFQYRLSFKGGAAGSGSAALREVEASYLLPNEAPKFQSFDVTGGGSAEAGGSSDAASTEPSGGATLHVSWEATDANKDTLEYTLQYRPVGGDAEDWRPLKDHITGTSFIWDTRGVPDGRYQLRVSASDAQDNRPDHAKTAARVSNVLLVDNTAPTISKPTIATAGLDATLTFSATDVAGTIARMAYRVDAADDWRMVSSADQMLDSPSEDFVLKLPALTAGRHVVQLQATDDKGNAGFTTVIVTIAK